MKKYSQINSDYDKRVKIDRSEYNCYSKKQFNKISKTENVKIIGEVKRGAKENIIGQLFTEGQEALDICVKGSVNRLLFHSAGFIGVGDGMFVELFVINKMLMATAISLATLSVASTVTYVSVVNNHNNPTTASEATKYNPLPPIESSQEPYTEHTENTDTTKKDTSDGGGEVTLTYSLDAYYSTLDRNIKMNVKNPQDSTHDIRLNLYVKGEERDYLIAQSGRITIGNGLKILSYEAEGDFLEEGKSYGAYYIIEFYNPDTGEKALLDTKIDDVILVVNK